MSILKDERKELRTLLYEKIESVKNQRDLNEIAQKLFALNDFLDDKDTKLENAFDSITMAFSSSQMSKIKKTIDDILDKYDKVKKNKEPYYSRDERMKIQRLVCEIDEICNRGFADRIRDVLRIGS